MTYRRQYLDLGDEEILAQCQVDIYKSSGPGGQHRNKVSSAVRLRHRPTGVTAHGDDSRSQHQNKLMALQRLRMNLACRLRQPVQIESSEVPPFVAECMFQPRGRPPQASRRLEVGRKDRRFWHVAAFLLDVLDAFGGHLADSAAYVGVTTGNLTSLLKSDRHLLAVAQAIRKRFGQKPLS
jgi:hypothetical protein